VIHGGLSYDDPIETITVEGPLYPVYDEAGAGSLQAVLNKTGDLIARNVPNDAFGGENLDLAGAAVDRVHVTAKKTSAGAIESVKVTIGSTEQINAAGISGGVRLASVDAAGALVNQSTSTPSVGIDPSTIQWTLTEPEWTALTSGASALSIAVTNTLRASSWSADVPFLPAPQWAIMAKPVYTSAAHPVEVRESLASLSSFLASIPADGKKTSKLYEVEGLALLATAGNDSVSGDIASARFHAHPFTEPMTQLDYVRTRWYQPLSGTWLSPDPKGYVDSSNMYAFAGGDPVNGRDPDGRDDERPGAMAGAATAVKERIAGIGRCIGLFEHYVAYRYFGRKASASQEFAYRWECVYPTVEAIDAGPVETIGGGAERYRAAIEAAAARGDRHEVARLSAHAGLDFLALAAAFDAPASASPRRGATPEPVAVSTGGSASAVPVSTVPAPPLVSPITLASGLQPDNGTDAQRRGRESNEKGERAEDAVSEDIDVPRNTGQDRATVPGTGPGGIRIPDFDPEVTIVKRGSVVEVKNWKKIHNTQQLRDLLNYARSQGAILEIFTNARAPKTGGLADAIRQGMVVLRPIPGS
jgi:RHS repeat-associated protein